MKTRRFGMLDWEVSVLGFGVMRLPLIDEDPEKIDEAQSIRMVRYAIDQGVNYLDLGDPSRLFRHDRMGSLISRALQDGYRNRIKLAATLPSLFIHSSGDFDRTLNEQLRRLQMDRIDFCLLGGLNRESWPKLQAMDILRLAEGALADGRIDKLGFSFHDDFQVLRKILEDYDHWALGQFQYSYMDVDHHPGISGLQYAAEKGLAVVIVEPLKGGRLTKKLPRPIAQLWASAPEKRTPAEWGLCWVWNHPEVSVAVTDMGTMEQVSEDVAFADRARPDSLSVRELVLISDIREAYGELRPIPCTSCRACMPCPRDIDVPRIFELYNDAILYKDGETARSLYCSEQHRADSCTECRACENACAKRLPVLSWFDIARKLLIRTH